MNKNLNKFYFFFNFFLIIQISNAYSCKSLDGKNVDWFYAYKLPLINSLKGTTYYYIDSKTDNNTWIKSNKSIDNLLSNIGQTVSQIFDAKKNKSNFFALYNDENPYTLRVNNNRGHMKGVLIFDDFEGIWLIHSVPRFPSTKKKRYFYPESGKRNGQTFLCVTFPTHLLNDIGSQLLISQTPFYEKQFPSSYAKLYPNLDKALKNKKLTLKNYFLVKQLNSTNNEHFLMFSKHKKFNKDLYADLIAPQLNTSLYVESWLNGPHNLPSYCNSYNKVFNLRSINFTNYRFKSSQDHSKWAVSIENKDSWICIGDINRQVSQEHRGGGAMCLKNFKVFSLFRQSVENFEFCKK